MAGGATILAAQHGNIPADDDSKSDPLAAYTTEQYTK
jgi:hypothetical protein